MTRLSFTLACVATILATAFPSMALADMGPQGFRAYTYNSYFVETGSFHGKGIHKALKAGFSVIHSLEINPIYVAECRDTFARYPHIHVWHKDSGKHLWDVISTIYAPITFWLDGHNIAVAPKVSKNCPIMEELEQIKRHPIKTHTILIDDRHVMGTAHFDGITEQQIINKLLEINPNYKITYDVGGGSGEYSGNVIVASVR